MKIGIVAIIGQLDMPYVKEWLEYHYAIGVNEVWLFMNDWNPIERYKDHENERSYYYVVPVGCHSHGGLWHNEIPAEAV